MKESCPLNRNKICEFAWIQGKQVIMTIDHTSAQISKYDQCFGRYIMITQISYTICSIKNYWLNTKRKKEEEEEEEKNH